MSTVRSRNYSKNFTPLESLEARTMLANTAPSFTTSGPTSITLAEDAPLQTHTNWATSLSAGPPADAGQRLAFSVVTDNNALFGVRPTVGLDGKLQFSPARNASGVAHVTITLTDSGGTDGGGADTSTPQTVTVTVNPVNDAPTFTSVASSGTSFNTGANFTLTAKSVADIDGTISAVRFYRDVNKNSVIDANDILLGTGTQSGANWSLTASSSGFANGANRFLVQAEDNGGAFTVVRSINVTFNLIRIATFTSAPSPLRVNKPYTLSANVTGSTASVAFYQDVNGNGFLEAGDTLLGAAVNTGKFWTLTLNNTFPKGTVKLIAQATDTYGGLSLAKVITLKVVK